MQLLYLMDVFDGIICDKISAWYYQVGNGKTVCQTCLVHMILVQKMKQSLNLAERLFVPYRHVLYGCGVIRDKSKSRSTMPGMRSNNLVRIKIH